MFAALHGEIILLTKYMQVPNIRRKWMDLDFGCVVMIMYYVYTYKCIMKFTSVGISSDAVALCVEYGSDLILCRLFIVWVFLFNSTKCVSSLCVNQKLATVNLMFILKD